MIPTQRIAARQCREQLFDRGKFKAMKTLSGCRTLHCGEHQFHAKNTWAVFELSLFEQSGHNEESKKEYEKWHFRYCI